jgi:hypothetical protein
MMLTYWRPCSPTDHEPSDLADGLTRVVHDLAYLEHEIDHEPTNLTMTPDDFNYELNPPSPWSRMT